MRQVYMPKEGLRFRPDVSVAAELLPEVMLLDFTFLQPSPQSPFIFSDLVSELSILFGNGRRLVLNGAYLWKFLDAIPPELGSDEHGWNDVNPYGPWTCELLMRRIRATYQAMLEEEGFDYEVRPPLRARLNLVRGTSEVVFPAEMAQDVAEAFDDYFIVQLSRYCLPVAQFLSNLVETALTQPRTILEHYSRDDGYIGKRHVQAPWPANALASMTLGNFLKESAHDEGFPWRRPYRELVDEHMQGILEKGFMAALKKVRQADPGLLVEMANQLRFQISPSLRLNSKPILAALNASRDAERLHYLASSYFLPKGTEEMPLNAVVRAFS